MAESDVIQAYYSHCDLCDESTPIESDYSHARDAARRHDGSEQHRMNEVHESRSSRRG